MGKRNELVKHCVLTDGYSVAVERDAYTVLETRDGAALVTIRHAGGFDQFVTAQTTDGYTDAVEAGICTTSDEVERLVRAVVSA